MVVNIRSFRDLRVWRQGIEIIKETYEYSRKFPKSEIYGLAGQMQRAAVSIPSNITEGHIRGSDREFNRFLQIALGSCAELETQFIIAKELAYVNESEVSKFIQALNEEAKQIRTLSKQIFLSNKTTAKR